MPLCATRCRDTHKPFHQLSAERLLIAVALPTVVVIRTGPRVKNGRHGGRTLRGGTAS
jgi:hypothetical protein